MSNKAIPSVAGEMVERARKGGVLVTEHLTASPWGLVGLVDLKAPGETREFLTIYVGHPAAGSKRRRVSYVESSGQLTQRLADRALRTVLRQLAREHAERQRLVKLGRILAEIEARHPEVSPTHSEQIVELLDAIRPIITGSIVVELLGCAWSRVENVGVPPTREALQAAMLAELTARRGRW